MYDLVIELVKEFIADAEMLEVVANDYKQKDMTEQYSIIWHEAAVYRCCALRLEQATQEEKFS